MDEREVDDRTLDANAVAGMLEQIFGADMTAADSVCAGCGRSSAALLAARPGCNAV